VLCVGGRAGDGRRSIRQFGGHANDDYASGARGIYAPAHWFVAQPDEAGLALQLHRVGMIELHGFAGVARKASDRPSVSRFARYQAARGDVRVTTLGHRTLELSDEDARKSVGLMDGSRDRAELER
jgi:hypothetical protein